MASHNYNVGRPRVSTISLLSRPPRFASSKVFTSPPASSDEEEVRPDGNHKGVASKRSRYWTAKQTVAVDSFLLLEQQVEPCLYVSTAACETLASSAATNLDLAVATARSDEIPAPVAANDTTVTDATSSDGNDSTCSDNPFQHLPKDVSGSVNVQAILKELSDKELEQAASTAYQYSQLSSQQPGEIDSHEQASPSPTRKEYASRMALRHLRAERGDPYLAWQKLKQTLQFRTDKCLFDTREAFTQQSPAARDRQRRIKKYLGPKGKLFVRGYDRQGHAMVHCVGRHSPADSQNDAIGCMLAFLYTLEKAIACSEAHPDNTDGMIVVSVDFAGYHKSQVPPKPVVVQLMAMLRDHYPERLYRVYLVDAPMLFRTIWAIFFKPFLDPNTKAKFQFVTGRHQRSKLFRHAVDKSQCMPYQHPNGQQKAPMDMHTYFYELPVDQAYDDR